MSKELNRVEVMIGLRMCKDVHCQLCPYDGNGCMRKLVSDAYDLLYNMLKTEVDSFETEPNNVKCKECEYLMFSDCYGECSKGYKGIVNPNDSCGKGKKEMKEKNK